MSVNEGETHMRRLSVACGENLISEGDRKCTWNFGFIDL